MRQFRLNRYRMGDDLHTSLVDFLADAMHWCDLTSETTNHLTNKVNELQKMNVFNTAINVASLDAGIRIAAGVDANAWFLNPQTGVVNLSNIAMTTTAIGAMNSSITRLGANLAK